MIMASVVVTSVVLAILAPFGWLWCMIVASVIMTAVILAILARDAWVGFYSNTKCVHVNIQFVLVVTLNRFLKLKCHSMFNVLQIILRDLLESANGRHAEGEPLDLELHMNFSIKAAVVVVAAVIMAVFLLLAHDVHVNVSELAQEKEG